MRILGPWKPQRRKKLFYSKLITLIIVCLIVGICVLDHYCKTLFPTTPYRDYFGYYLKERIVRGLIILPISNIFSTKSENLSTTKLPVWEIQLSGRKLAALSNDLPKSGRIYQSGTMLINSSPFSARFRFKGDGLWHWKSKQKSWKIQLREGQRFEGKREFNLVNPREPTTLIWPLTSYIAQSMGLKTPLLRHAHARLNGQYLGVLYLVENFDHDFIVQSGLPKGALYEDEALGPYHHQSWKEIDTWKIRPPGEKRKHQAGKDPQERYETQLRELLSCLTLENDGEFFQKLEELVDLPQHLKWWAHATLCLDTHQDHKHNNRLYLDPTSAKFRQIPWDMDITWGKDPHDEIDLNLNPITQRLLQSPEYAHARNEIIWKAIKGPVHIDKIIHWLDKTADLIREDVYCDPYKDAYFITVSPLRSILSKKMILSMYIQPVVNSIFEETLDSIRAFLIERVTYLEQVLSTTDVKLFFCLPSPGDVSLPDRYIPVGLLNLKVGGQAGIVVKEIKVRFTSDFPSKRTPFLFYGNSGPLVKVEGEKINDFSSDDIEVYTFKVDELLLPGRRRKTPFGPTPVRYIFTVACGSSENSSPTPFGVELIGTHPLTEEKVSLKASLSELQNGARSILLGKFQPPLPTSRKIIWKGFKKLDKDFQVKKDEILVIHPGTRIESTGGTSLLSHGKIVAIGTVKSPIIFTRAPDCNSWGVVALQGAGASCSVFKYCTFEYGGEDEIEGVFYSGALSVYNATVAIEKCVFRLNRGDDALNTKFSSTDVLQSKFVNNKADAYDLDFSSGLVVGNIFEKNGNDGIDCGTAHPILKDNRILYCGDKGISIGERSNPIVEDNLLAHCKVGIAIKDQSHPLIRKNEFQFNEIAVEAYQKKKVFGGVKVAIHDSRFVNNGLVSESDKLSSISLRECLCDGGPCAEE